MAEFKVIEGRLSEDYNIFEEHEFLSCTATNTRLMGVVAMRIYWRSIYDDTSLYQQVLYLDFSEYGIDEFFEYRLDSRSEYFEEDLMEVESAWRDTSKDLGGTNVLIEPHIMMRLIDDAIKVGEDNILKGVDRFREFRLNAAYTMSLMRDRLAALGHLDKKADALEAIAAVSPSELSTYETINYFLMRLADRDFIAASHLSDLSIEELSNQHIPQQGIQSLIKNSIGVAEREESNGNLFACETITLARETYYLSTSVVELSGSRDDKDRMVIGLRTGFCKKLSNFELAGLLSLPEYLTVYDIPDEELARFDYADLGVFADASPKLQDNGWMLPVYYKNNSHVDKSIYHIRGDIQVCALVTIPGELVVMSTKLVEVSDAEKSIAESYYGDKLVLKGRFHIGTSIFQTLCTTTGAMLSDLVKFQDPEE